jgi:hypothetical protein
MARDDGNDHRTIGTLPWVPQESIPFDETFQLAIPGRSFRSVNVSGPRCGWYLKDWSAAADGPGSTTLLRPQTGREI